MLEQVTFPNGESVFLSSREQMRLAKGTDRPGMPNLREIFFRPLERLETEVEEQGGRVIIVLMPSKEELYGAKSFPDVLRAVREVRAELEARHLPVLDLYPATQKLGQERPPFYRVDMHPNELGNQIAADAIAKWIGEEQIFPPPSLPAPGVATAATK
jgi:SGNH hydrolase-like domain, acetyltransferase AlgX